ncbi:hypothetical protein TVAG_375880 [Trichomonas vaginalis G3]|uniref:Ubiquitin-like domain-containing protein n=1 Tax=Trichomonas vaginalis (strain ATCC PRA-98 / G3) TaxID=412133 RepID=A2G1M0_TRIV3|nr:modification-dependent protein catabolic process [Trichomonas vaginalis G3]EAX88940.1 hypothetical protein TVAG_375880 [Trichomonas vaginalis G3]KAI5535803.1 modification-dependent protein catabolic process [Trichomonas vaginalis G3]|eukprot:XP_001301870.1 hypothetical protein [Trichomonas vaginalis G3]
MKIGIQWARGKIKLEVDPNEPIQSVINRFAESIKTEPNYVVLYKILGQNGYEGRLDNKLTVGESNLHNFDMTYAKLLTEKLPDVEYGNSLGKAFAISDFIKQDTIIPEHIKEFTSEFGPKAVNVQFFELADSLIPQVINQTESSTYAIRVGVEAIKRFQIVSLNEHFKNHRMMFLFGRVDKITGKVTVHCGMEPPQFNSPDHFTIVPEFEMLRPCQIAQSFGMQCVGMAVAHNYGPKLPLPGYLLKLAAHFQVKFGEYFTTLVFMPNGTNNIEVNAYQVSDAVTKLENLGLIEEPKSYSDQKEIGLIRFKKDVRVSGAKKRFCNVNFCLCAVRVRKVNSKIPSHDFPSPNSKPTKTDLIRYLDDNEYSPTWRKFFDFNFLVYLVSQELITIKDIGDISTSIVTMTDIPKRIVKKVENYYGKNM